MTGYKEIDAKELFDMMSSQKLVLIDVRNDDEVARGTIPGALHIPLAMIPVKYDSLNDQKALVFYCHSGIRSAQASAYLASKGRNNIFNLQGGVLAWGRAGYPFAPKDA
ncbi:MAG: rhodanese-like domain-containing protein [Methylophilaceae bacterium]|uniref:rhodanese-like domain-containing protein n=1 Tax=Methylovorus sp. MM2 TaxID=1848038 RepID=UPI0007DF2C54|nr:rhodanese-like domain-containing protein [Methylovorus sp. MM2]OAM51839.1 sulfurtransferase [Methylovorus sp. MM2]